MLPSLVLILCACIAGTTISFAQETPIECETPGSQWPEVRPLDVQELDSKHCSTLVLNEGDHLFSSTSALPKLLCTIKGTSVGGKSATVYLQSPLKLTCANVTFSGSLNFKALGQTSCVQGVSSTVRISEDANASFNGCWASTQGGGINAQTVELAGVASFDSCHAGEDGGALYVHDCITILQGASLLISNCSASGVKNNGGGGIYSAGCMKVMGQISLQNCKARHGACVRTEKDMIVSDNAEAVFNNCTSSYWGGGMRVGGNLRLGGHTWFNKCSASFAGGAFKCYGVVTMSGSIVFNKCNSTWGGAVNAQNEVHILENSKVTYNSCYAKYDGGGVLCISTFKVMSGAEIAFNECRAGRTGGGVRAELASNSAVSFAKDSFTSFTRCHATEGGGIYILPKLKVLTSHYHINLDGDMDFNFCSATIGSGVRMPESNGYANFGEEQSIRFKDMCRSGNADTLISGPINKRTNFAILNNETGWMLEIHKQFGLRCVQCPFGKFSFVKNSTISTQCVSCSGLSRHVDNDRVGCWSDVVDLDKGIMMTRHPSRNSSGESAWVYDSWLCPQTDACPSATIRHDFTRSSQCANGHNNTATLPACATCSYGYNPSQYDPFACKKCSGLKLVTLLFPIGFYLLSVYSAGKPRSSMAAIQNIFLTWGTSSIVPISVLESSSSLADVKSALSHALGFGKAPVATPTAWCLFLQQCTKFECAHKNMAASFGSVALVYPCAEIIHRIAARFGVNYGPMGNLRTRLSVHVAIAANFFMPMLVSTFLKFIPCAMVQTNPDAYRVSWFWAEECDSREHLLRVLAAIFGIIMCIVCGPVNFCLLIARGPLGKPWAGRKERYEAMGFTLTSYHDGWSKYWDALVLFRKMSLVSLSTVFPLSYNPSLFCVATLGTLTFFFVLHLACRPYHSRHQIHGISLNALEDLGQAVPLISGFLALGLLQAKIHWFYSEVFILLLLFLMNIFVFVTLVYFFIWAVIEDESAQRRVRMMKSSLGMVLPTNSLRSVTGMTEEHGIQTCDSNLDGLQHNVEPDDEQSPSHWDEQTCRSSSYADFSRMQSPASDAPPSQSVADPAALDEGSFRDLDTRFRSLETYFSALEQRVGALTPHPTPQLNCRDVLQRPLLD